MVQNASLFAHCDPGFIKSIVVRLRPQARGPFFSADVSARACGSQRIQSCGGLAPQPAAEE